MSDTPETDGEWNRIACYEHPQFEQAIADFARKIERERDVARLDLAFRRDLYALQQKQLDEARGSIRKLSVAVADSIRFSGARQDETEEARDECNELRILVDGLLEMNQKLSDESNSHYNELLTKRGLCKVQEQVIDDWKAEAEKWRAIANDNRN